MNKIMRTKFFIFKIEKYFLNTYTQNVFCRQTKNILDFYSENNKRRKLFYLSIHNNYIRVIFYFFYLKTWIK